jgi:hypothetical protein
MADLTKYSLIGIIILIIGLIFLLVAAALFFIGTGFELMTSLVSSFILILIGAICYFYGEGSSKE